MTTTTKKPEHRFPLGNLYITAGVRIGLPMVDVLAALSRHACGDWGQVGEEDWEANEQALVHGSRLLSAYEMQEGKRVWIITEADRSATTVLFPDEY